MASADSDDHDLAQVQNDRRLRDGQSAAGVLFDQYDRHLRAFGALGKKLHQLAHDEWGESE